MSRPTTSVGPAPANGTMTLTGRSGYPGLCARPALASRRPAPAVRTRGTGLGTLMACLRVVLIQARCGGLVMQDNPFLPVPSPAYDRNGATGERLENAAAQCKRVLARPNVNARRQPAQARPVRREVFVGARR